MRTEVVINEGIDAAVESAKAAIVSVFDPLYGMLLIQHEDRITEQIGPVEPTTLYRESDNLIYTASTEEDITVISRDMSI